MKQEILIIFTILNISVSFSQETFVNFATAYLDLKGEYGSIDKINEINLYSDNTFIMWMFPMSSCLFWRSYKGRWTRNRNIIELINKYEVFESDVKCKYKNSVAKEFKIVFTTEKNLKLTDLKIKIEFKYDFKSKIEAKKIADQITNKNGMINIPFESIPYKDQLAAIKFETSYKGRIISEYLTENEIVNWKKSEIPNEIKVTIVENPKKEIITRKIRAKYDDDKLVILSIKKSNGRLPDHQEDLELEKIYTKVKE